MVTSVLVAGVTAVWVRSRPFRVEVAGHSMAPELLPGDFLIAARTRVRRGDLVVLEHPGRPGFELVKRVTGLPGDDVDGRRLGPGEIWLRGERDVGSTDSRTFGPVSETAVRGVVRLRYWPPGRAGLLR